jgi:uncharacterized protein YndB with AHSA1/START domain
MCAGKSDPQPSSEAPELVLTRLIDAPCERVFEAWTDAAQVAKWWGPKGFTNPVCEIDGRSGGAMRIHMRGPDGTIYPMSGAYREVKAPERIVFAGSALDENGKPIFEILHTVTFAAEGAKTRLTLRAAILSTTPTGAPHLKGQEAGWSQSLDRLETHLTGAPAKPTSTSHGTFVIERVFAFKPAQVFAAWADPVAKARWFVGPEPWKALERECDFRVGGGERVKGGWPGGMTTTFSAGYHNIVPNERLVYVYDMRVNETLISISLATIEFRAEKDGTRLVLTEQGAFLDGYDDAGAREKGTGMLLEQLDAALRSAAAPR